MELTERILKSLRRLAVIFLAVAIVTGLLGLLDRAYLRFNPAAERHYGRLVHVSIGGRDFAIPSEYFRGPLPPEKTDRVHLWVMLPDYTPYRGEITGNRDQIRAAWKRHLTVDVEDVASTSGMAAKYDAFKNGPLNKNSPRDVADEFGLRHTHVWYSNKRSPEPWILHDLYFQKAKDGTLLNFIRCDRSEPNKTGICSYHIFQDGQLLYTISYGRSNLPHWQIIQTRVNSLIDSFSCTPRSNLISSQKHNGGHICPR